MWVYLPLKHGRRVWYRVSRAERRESAGYVGISAAKTRTGSLVRSSGAHRSECRRVMLVYLPLNHGREAWWEVAGRVEPRVGGLCGYICRCNTDGEYGNEQRGAERRESAGYVGISAAKTRTESLVTSSGRVDPRVGGLCGYICR